MNITYDPAAHAYTVNGRPVPSVTQVLADTGIIDTRWFTEESRQRGTAVHAACEFLDEGDLDESTIDPIAVPYLDAYRGFLAEHRPEIVSVETKVHSEVYRYAGRLDRVVIMNGIASVLDIKTGVTLYPSTAVSSPICSAVNDRSPRNTSVLS